MTLKSPHHDPHTAPALPKPSSATRQHMYKDVKPQLVLAYPAMRRDTVAAPSSVKLGLEYSQVQGSHRFSRQPVPGPHHPQTQNFFLISNLNFLSV